MDHSSCSKFCSLHVADSRVVERGPSVTTQKKNLNITMACAFNLELEKVLIDKSMDGFWEF